MVSNLFVRTIYSGDFWTASMSWFFGVVLWRQGREQLRLARLSTDWVEGQCLVKSSTIKVRERVFSPIPYRSDVFVTYTYVVDGVEYKGNRVFFGSPKMEKAAMEILYRFTPGLTAPVYYDPRNPAESVLIPGGEGGAGWQILAGVILLVSAVWSTMGYFRALSIGG